MAARQINIHKPKTIVPVVQPDGRLVFLQWETNIGVPHLQQGSDGVLRLKPEYAEKGYALLADLYAKEPDDYRREEGVKTVRRYIAAWQGPNPDQVAGVTIPDHLLPQEVIDRREGRSEAATRKLEFAPDPNARAKGKKGKGDAPSLGA